jgi:hypothetical protein
MWYLLCVVWYTIGIASFTYWWTVEADLTVAEMPILLCSSCLGLIAYVAGYFIHGRPDNTES